MQKHLYFGTKIDEIKWFQLIKCQLLLITKLQHENILILSALSPDFALETS